MMFKKQYPHPLLITLVLIMGAVALFYLGLGPIVSSALLVFLAGLVYFLLPRISSRFRIVSNVYQPSHGQDQALLSHLEVEGESAALPEKVVFSEDLPEEEEVSADIEELEAETLSPQLIQGVKELLENLTSGLKNEAGEGQNLSIDLANLKNNADFINENVVRAFEISDNLANTAKEAFELSEHVQSGVKVVTDALSSSMENTEELFHQSKKITKILEIMSDISNKIHVLSINASIVSARAGSAGKGFEVVAKEIRTLAKGTESSLLDIEAVIEELQTNISSVIEKVEVANKETEEEKNALMSVAGSLQGVILAVEIIRAVSSVARDKSVEQGEILKALLQDVEQVTDSEKKTKVEQYLIQLQQILDSMN